MGSYISPLVAVNEIDLTTTIPAVQTSVGVIILQNTWKGSENKKTLVTSESDLISFFGEPTYLEGNWNDMQSALAFLKDANILYCTRALPISASFAGTTATSGASASFVAYNSATAPILGDDGVVDPDKYYEEVTVSGTNTMKFIAASRGEWGNRIRVAVVSKADYDKIKKRQNSGWQIYNTVYVLDSPVESNTEFLVVVQYCPQGSSTAVEAKWKTVEVWNVSTDRSKVDDQGNNMFVETSINNSSNYIRVAFNATLRSTDWTTSTPTWQTFGGGVNYSSQNETESVPDSVIMNALDLYANAEEIDVNLFIDSDKSVAIKQYIIGICESRLDSMVILDPPSEYCINNIGSETTDLADWRNNTLNENTSYASLYSSWLEVYDKFSGKYRWVSPSGYVAGVYARNDSLAQAWYAPAGFNRAILRNVRKLSWNPDQGQRDVLYKNGINPLVSFSGQGKVVFGQKTLLDKDSAFNRVNVRRLFIVLEKSIATACKYFLFEPNDEVTRMLLVNTIDPYLRDVRGKRGIQEFLIVCDTSNNTGQRIDANELWCDIYIKPTRAAEFIVLNFVATATGASFQEMTNVLSSISATGAVAV
jgi:hypothetical protein